MPTLPRGTCATCGRDVAVQAPRGGDGSLFLTRRHNDADGAPCPGSRKEPAPYEEHGADTGHELADQAPGVRASEADGLTDRMPETSADHQPASGVAVGEELDGHLTPNAYIELPGTLTGGMTIWGYSAGLQVRPAHCAQDSTVGALALIDDCPQVDGLYLLDAETLKAIRDLLNIATARGVL